jgi:spermidine dehydrogenase
MDSVVLDFPVSLGGYEFARSPADPMILHWTYVPTEPGKGLDARTQNWVGRQKMLGLAFEDYERAMRSQAPALSAGGFDPAGDILAITVNRWPHGYAYEYNDLLDRRVQPLQWPPRGGAAGFRACVHRRLRCEAYAYVSSHRRRQRAVVEQLGSAG